MAQDALLGQIYGNGVHAYFAQDYVKAHELLSSAIDAHAQDPRCYYFRGLALLKLGRPEEAESDFERGAKLESSIDPVRAYDVARALERVQGNDRTTLEKYRMGARMSVLKRAEEENRMRYTASLKEQREFLQRQAGPAPAVEKPGQTPGAVQLPGDGDQPGAVSSNPFDEGTSPLRPGKSDAAPAGSDGPDALGPAPKKSDAVPPDDDVFALPGGEKPTPQADRARPGKGADDVFAPPGGEKPAAPAGGAAPKKSDAEGVEDPFALPGEKPAAPAGGAAPKKSDAAPTEEDPFALPGEKKPAAPAGGAAPKKSDAAPTEEDPFAVPGEKPAAPAGGAAPKKSDAAPTEEDPFALPGEKKPAAPAGGATKPTTPAAGTVKPDTGKAAGKKPESKPGAVTDPFADEPAAPAANEKKPADAKRPAEEKKPAAEVDPFG
jgi:hypothetical protein